MIKSLARRILNRSRLASAARLNLQMIRIQMLGRERRANRSWSQHGEDARLVFELRDCLGDGYYVDVGANHPARLSNTYRLYNLGMRGICVEPNDLLCAMHQRYRPGDYIINTAVGSEHGFARFYEMSQHLFSTFSESDAKMRQESGVVKLLRVTFKPVFRLETILHHCVPEGRNKMALLSVDTEGWDEIVLRSNDWNRFRPRLVIVESNDEQAAQSVASFMTEMGYASVAAFGINALFKDARPSPEISAESSINPPTPKSP